MDNKSIIRTVKVSQIEETKKLTFFAQKLSKYKKKYCRLKNNAYLCIGIRK